MPAQLPLVHESPTVFELLSSQALPSALSGLEQTPVAGAQTPATWHWSSAVQVTPTQRFTPPHRPLVQVSLAVAGLPSSQAVPFAALGLEQAPVAWSMQVPATW